MYKNNNVRGKVTDEKRTNFRMYKSGRQWIYASALMLSIMGFTTIKANEVSAATADPTQSTAVAAQSAASTDDDSSSARAEATNNADTAATDTQAVATEATPAAASAPATKTETVPTPSAPVAKAEAAPSTKTEVVSAPVSTPAPEVETVPVPESKVAVESDQEKAPIAEKSAKPVEEIVSSDTEKLQAASPETAEKNKFSAAVPEVVKAGNTTESGTKLTAENKHSDVKQGNTKQADAESKSTDSKTDKIPVVEYKSAQATTADGGIGVDFLATGTMTATGNGSSGLKENADGDYTGIVTIEYSGTSLGLEATDSDFVLKIPTELQPLIAAADKSDITGTVSTGIISGNHSYTQDEIDISSDGSTVTFSNPTSFVIVVGTVDATVNLNLGDMVNKTNIKIPDSNNNYQFDGAVVVPGSIINWDVFSDRIASTNLATNQLMPNDNAAEIQPPYVVQPITDTTTTITGTGVAGATINIDDALKNHIGDTVIGTNGSYSVNISKQTAGTVLEITQTTVKDGTSNPTTIQVQHVPVALAAPFIDQTNDGDTSVTGAGDIPGALIIVKDATNTTLGQDYVTTAKTFHVDLNRALKGGEVINAVMQNDSDTSIPTVQRVATAETDVQAPTLDSVHANADAITGSSTEDSVRITDPAGDLIGSAKVEDGKFSVPVKVVLKEGDVVVATALNAAGDESKSVSTTVLAAEKEVEAPTLDPVHANADAITGSSTEDTVRITDEAGDFLGSAKVEDGKFSVPVKAILKEGDVVVATALNAAGDESKSVNATVLAAEKEVEAPTLDPVHANTDAITGSSTEDTVRITDEAGDFLGSAKVEDGKFSVPVKAILKEGDVVIATALNAAGDESKTVSTTVLAVEKEVEAPTLDPVHANTDFITGSSTEDTVRITDPAGDLIGSAKVQDGKFSVPVKAILNEGDVVVATALNAAGDESKSVNATVLAAEKEVEAPTIDPVHANADAITGSSTEDTVRITDPAGDLIGSAKVENGKFSVPVKAILKEGDVVVATALNAAGDESKSVSTTVLPAVEVPQPKLDDLTADAKTITGTSEAGLIVTVSDGASKEIGHVKVGDDGKFSVPVTDPLTAGETISAVATDDAGNKSEAGKTIVKEAMAVPVPEVHSPITPTTNEITGKTEPKAKVTATDDGGAMLGTVTAGDDGTFSIPIKPGLAVGSSVVVTAEVDGKTSEPTTVPVTADETQEVVKVSLKAMKDGEPTIIGTATPGATVKISINRGDAITELGSVTVADDGSFSLTLPDGTALKGLDIIAAQQLINGQVVNTTERAVNPVS